jgi:hypothetical protein
VLRYNYRIDVDPGRPRFIQRSSTGAFKESLLSQVPEDVAIRANGSPRRATDEDQGVPMFSARIFNQQVPPSERRNDDETISLSVVRQLVL